MKDTYKISISQIERADRMEIKTKQQQTKG
jgi:hypothetical protein